MFSTDDRLDILDRFVKVLVRVDHECNQTDPSPHIPVLRF